MNRRNFPTKVKVAAFERSQARTTAERAKRVADELRAFDQPMVPPADMNAFLLKLHDDVERLKRGRS